VRAEQDARAAVERGEAGDQVRPAGADDVEGDARAELLEPVAEVVGELGLAGAVGSGRVVRIDGRNADQFLKQADDIGGHAMRVRLPAADREGGSWVGDLKFEI